MRCKDSDGVERLYGRGMSDDKDQVMTFLEACRAYVAGSLPLSITVLLEGELSYSPGTGWVPVALLARSRARLASAAFNRVY